MTTILAIAGWIVVSTVCTPLIGQFLHITDAERVQTLSQTEARATFGLLYARRDNSRRRSAANTWPRKDPGRPKAG